MSSWYKAIEFTSQYIFVIFQLPMYVLVDHVVQMPRATLMPHQSQDIAADVYAPTDFVLAVL